MILSAVEQFAASYDERAILERISRHWMKTLPISAIYIILVFSGKRWMKDRPKFKLRWALTLWSAALALFSMFGAWFMLVRTVKDLREFGFRYTVCDNTFLFTGHGVWLYWFCLSKIVELGDTFFIVVRKQKLIFLHWYHHMVTLIYSCYAYGSGVAAGRYFAGVNFAIHTLMYSYYAIRASGLVRMPRQVNITLTSLQLLQMGFGVYLNIYAYTELTSGRPCDNTWPSIYSSFLMYASYVALFANFFYQNYLVKSKSDPKVNNNMHSGAIQNETLSHQANPKKEI